ncbi:hypothetical protein V8F33_012913 [Rhypophila sp. PSN 637]
MSPPLLRNKTKKSLVANLATFRTYHSIVDHSSLFAYVDILVAHLVLRHAPRCPLRPRYRPQARGQGPADDCFVGFALVGSAFAPGTEKGDNTNFRILCYTLVLSRTLFSIQYMVVGTFTAMARRTDLFVPLTLNTVVYLVAAGAFAAMISKFPDDKKYCF